MPRPRNVTRTVFKNIGLREDLAARLELELYSEAERRIPLGAQQRLFNQLLEEHFKRADAQRRDEENE